MNEKRYYWLKLEENYFDLKVQKALRKLPSGADMLICYLKMQLKYLNKSGLIEYQGIYEDVAQEIALDIDEEVDIVKMTLAVLIKWKVIEQENTNLYLSEMQDRIGSKSDVALRVAKHREKQKMLQCNNDVTKCNSIKEIEIEKDIEIDKKENNKKKKYFENDDVNDIFLEFLEMRKKIRAVNSDRAIKTLINQLNNYDDEIKIKMIEQSIVNSWKGIFELKEQHISYRDKKKLEEEKMWEDYLKGGE